MDFTEARRRIRQQLGQLTEKIPVVWVVFPRSGETTHTTQVISLLEISLSLHQEIQVVGKEARECRTSVQDSPQRFGVAFPLWSKH